MSYHPITAHTRSTAFHRILPALSTILFVSITFHRLCRCSISSSPHLRLSDPLPVTRAKHFSLLLVPSPDGSRRYKQQAQLSRIFPGSVSSPGSPSYPGCPSCPGSPAPTAPAASFPQLSRLPWLPLFRRLPLFPQRPRFPLTWHNRRGERRSCERGREQALLDEESTGVIGGEGRGLSACLLWSRLASSRLSRNYCALSSGGTSAHPLRARLLSPHPVMPALAPPAIPTPTLSHGSCAFPSGHGSDRHACGRLLWSHLRP